MTRNQGPNPIADLLRDARLIPSDAALFAGGRDPNDRKLGQTTQRWPLEAEALSLSSFRAALVGFRSHEGVARNGGRIGAAEGPEAIRRALYRLNATCGKTGLSLERCSLVDLGDIALEESALEEAQARLRKAVGACLLAGVLPIVLGGGHETAYGHFLGYVEADLEVSIINVDAHLDVRDEPGGRSTSGTPFRQALEHPGGTLDGRYACLGARPRANSPVYADYAKSRGAEIHWFDEVRAEGLASAVGRQLASRHKAGGVMVSLDMDAVSSAYAPGTSAASPEGFSAEEFLAAARVAGQSRATASFEISEVSPPLDRDGQTALLAALAVWHFLRARAESAPAEARGGVEGAAPATR